MNNELSSFGWVLFIFILWSATMGIYVGQKSYICPDKVERVIK